MTGYLLKSLSVRLTILYAGTFCFSVTLLGAAYYWISVHQPRLAIRVLADRDFVAMRAIDETSGRAALIDALRTRKKGAGGRDHFFALVGRDGRTIIANLPSWPSRQESRWLEVEADDFVEGEEIDHYAILRDGALEDGARLLTGWADAPGARWCHPREEHLLPMHVCAGAGGGPARRVFDDTVLGKRASGYAWF